MVLIMLMTSKSFVRLIDLLFDTLTWNTVYLRKIVVASEFGILPSLLVPYHDEQYSSCTIASRPVERDAKSWIAKKLSD